MIKKALNLAINSYDEKTYAHVMRVAGYVASNNAIEPNYKEGCIVLAILHDILEDTKVTLDSLDNVFIKAIVEGLKILTKDKKEDYNAYCKNIRDKSDSLAGTYAYFVKLADMKDHLNLKDTLTDRLKEKYLEGLAELL